MAVLGNKKSKVSDEIPSSSMADIAFLLLIFFLVDHHLPQGQGSPDRSPGAGRGGRGQPEERPSHHREPEWRRSTIKRGESQQEQVVRPDDVENIWRLDVAQNPILIAAVKTHPDAPYRYMVDVLDALQAAGAPNEFPLSYWEG